MEIPEEMPKFLQIYANSDAEMEDNEIKAKLAKVRPLLITLAFIDALKKKW